MIQRSLKILVLLALFTVAVSADEAVVVHDALADAARDGDLATVKKLINDGLDVNAAVNQYGATALSFAADKGHTDIVRFLLEKGADVTVKDSFYNSEPITWAVFGGHAEIVGLMVESGAAAFPVGSMAVATENYEVALAVVATGKLTADELTKMLVAAEGAEATQVVEALKKAGAQPPPPALNLSPEALEKFTGVFHVAQFGMDFTITVGDGVLLMKNPNAPEPTTYEPTAPTEFRRQGGGMELKFELDGEKVTGFKAFQDGADEPFSFVRVEKGAGAEAPEVAEAPASETSPEAETAPEPAKAMAKIPVGAAGENWPSFRGPNAAGTAKGSPPVEWNGEEGKNILWKTPIPGRAHASPIVWGDRVFIATAVAKDGEEEFPGNVGGDVDTVEIKTPYSWEMYALNKKTGKVEWHEVAAEGMPRASHHITATQANSTPVTDGKHLVAVLGSEGLFAWDLNGKLLWKNDLGVVSVGWFYDSSYEWGYSASPIIHEDMVILQVDRHKEPFIAGYSLANGKEVWRTARENLPSYSSPSLLTANGKTELITNGSYRIRGYDPKTGKELWELGPTSELVVGTPVVGHGMAYVTGGYPPVRPIYAIRPGGQGDISTGEEASSNDHIAWSTTRGGTYEPTPLLYGDYLYMTNGAGVVTSYNAKTGEQMYRKRIAGRGGVAFTSSAVAADGRIYWLSDDGDGFVAELGEELELLAENPLGEPVMASPAISGDILLIRSLENVFAVGKSD